MSNGGEGNQPSVFLRVNMATESEEESENSNRVIVFIDGNNLYHRLKENSWITWINVGSLAKRLAGQRTLIHVYYYNSPPPNGKSHTKSGNKYLDEVKKTPNVTFRPSRLQATEKVDEYGHYHSFVEKGGDTAITTDMVSLAASDQYDVAILVTNDGDYEPACRQIKEIWGKGIEVVYFDLRRPFALERCALMRKFRKSYLVEYGTGNTSQYSSY